MKWIQRIIIYHPYVYLQWGKHKNPSMFSYKQCSLGKRALNTAVKHLSFWKQTQAKEQKLTQYLFLLSLIYLVFPCLLKTTWILNNFPPCLNVSQVNANKFTHVLFGRREYIRFSIYFRSIALFLLSNKYTPHRHMGDRGKNNATILRYKVKVSKLHGHCHFMTESQGKLLLAPYPELQEGVQEPKSFWTRPFRPIWKKLVNSHPFTEQTTKKKHNTYQYLQRRERERERMNIARGVFSFLRQGPNRICDTELTGGKKSQWS